MPFLAFRDPATGRVLQFDAYELRAGRDPSCEIALTGPGSEAVSSIHAQFRYSNFEWTIADLASATGTYIDDRLLSPGVTRTLDEGMILGFGSGGLRLVVLRVERRRANQAPSLASTLLPIRLGLREQASGRRFDAMALPIRIGRSPDCELRPAAEDATTVSRMHCEVTYNYERVIVLRELSSTNGTYLNGLKVTNEAPLKLNDRIRLGPSGSDLVVDVLEPQERRHFPQFPGQDGPLP